MKNNSLYTTLLVTGVILVIVVIISASILITRVHELELRMNNTDHDVILLIKQLEEIEMNSIN